MVASYDLARVRGPSLVALMEMRLIKNSVCLIMFCGAAALSIGCSGSDMMSSGTGGSSGEAGGPGTAGSTGKGGSSATAGGSGFAGSPGIAGAGVDGLKRFIGNISPKDKDIPGDFATMWQQVTMEANSKWGFVQPNSPDEWVWGPVDQVYQYALDHGLIFKAHTFFWNYEQPTWVNDSNVAAAAEKWIQAFCERYPKTALIDVANEPYHHPAPYAAGLGGAGTSGYDWVVRAHKWARQYCPSAILILNEYNNIEYDADFNAYVDMLKKVLAAGGPVDAIGIQGHDVAPVGVAKAKLALDRMVNNFHLPIYITEFDIDRSDDAQQNQIMQDAVTMFWNNPYVKGLTYWGYVQGLTWRVNGWLVDTNGNPRPAMTWLQDFMKSQQ
jgi:endo-1,4-beta-xylanase